MSDFWLGFFIGYIAIPIIIGIIFQIMIDIRSKCKEEGEENWNYG